MKRLFIFLLCSLSVSLMQAVKKSFTPKKAITPQALANQLAGGVTCQSCQVSEDGCVQCCGGPKHCRGPVYGGPMPILPVLPVAEPIEQGPVVECPAGCRPINECYGSYSGILGGSPAYPGHKPIPAHPGEFGGFTHPGFGPKTTEPETE